MGEPEVKDGLGLHNERKSRSDRVAFGPLSKMYSVLVDIGVVG